MKTMVTDVAGRKKTIRSRNTTATAQAVVVRTDRGFWRHAAAVRPGPNLPRAALAGLALSLICFFVPWTVILVLIGLLAVGVSIAAGLEVHELSRQLRRVQVRRALPSMIGRDVGFSVTWEIENIGDQSVAGLLRDVVPQAANPRFWVIPFQIPPGRRETLAGAYRIAERGWHSFGPFWICLHGRRGLMELQGAFDVTDSIKVLPEQFSSREELMKDRGAELLLLDKATRSRQHGAGTEFESLQEFREGDDPRRIDWRATARLRRPVVRRFQIERHRDVMILIDCGRLMGTETDRGTKLDCAVDAALILARVSLQSGDRCGIGLYDSDVRGYLPPISGLPSLHSIVESVFAAKSEFRESDFGPMFAMLQMRQAKRSLIVVLSDVADIETSVQFRASLARLARRHVVILAALRTPVLGRILKEPVSSIVDGAKKAVTFRLLRERQLAIQSLRHAGLFVLDVEPSQLTVPLVNQFIDVRQRNLL